VALAPGERGFNLKQKNLRLGELAVHVMRCPCCLVPDEEFDVVPGCLQWSVAFPTKQCCSSYKAVLQLCAWCGGSLQRMAEGGTVFITITPDHDPVDCDKNHTPFSYAILFLHIVGKWSL